MRDNEIDWEAEFGSARVRVRGASDDPKVAELIEQGQKTIADATASAKGSHQIQAEALALAKEAFPQWLATRGGPSHEDDGPCVADMAITFILALGRKGWKISIDSDDSDEEWVVEAVHPEHGGVRQTAIRLFDALDLLSGDLASHLGMDDA